MARPTMMLNSVFSPFLNFKVLDAIVLRVAVFVMDDLPRLKPSVKMVGKVYEAVS